MDREVEIKLIGLVREDFEKKIIDAGAKLDTIEDQTNIRIDSSKEPLPLSAYLRIRQVRIKGELKTTEFTYKVRKADESARVNEEYTVNIDDADKMIDLLKHLGFDKIDKGYKIRKRYLLEEYRIEFDSWNKESFPFPYIEVEAKSPQALDDFLSRFNIDRKYVSTASILELKKAWEAGEEEIIKIMNEGSAN